LKKPLARLILQTQQNAPANGAATAAVFKKSNIHKGNTLTRRLFSKHP